MADRTITNAKITRTSLGREDHGMLSACVHLSYGGSGQGFGNYVLSGEAMAMFVAGVIDTVGVDSWEDLPGCVLRAEYDYGRVYRIGHFLNDTWFDPEVEFAKLKKAAK